MKLHKNWYITKENVFLGLIAPENLKYPTFTGHINIS